MNKILFVNACVRPSSRTLELANYLLTKLSGKVEEVNLYNCKMLPLSLSLMQLRDNASKSNNFSDGVFDLAKQFASAETIVFAAPYWDLSFPSVVKTYLEQITVNGLTFKYGENGIPKGLCKAKRLIYVTTSGGPIIHNFGYDYLSCLAKNFYGIAETTCIKAEGLDIYGANVKEILENAKNSINAIY
ncbi:MAG: NAD(P)H-dependent oxidoreductase [Clostridia bacterium]|nr:NAD(P)H-dependent oxidoreductase [Clostridia bacterium]